MRTILLVSLTSLGACAGSPDPAAPPMASARAKEANVGLVPSLSDACVTRYGYPSLDVQIDCATEHVAGDPDHWVMTCALPADVAALNLRGLYTPPARYEATRDALGALMHEVIDLPPGVVNGYAAPHDVSYSYDADHRLAETTQLDASGAQIYHLVVGARDALGNPLATALTVPPLAPRGIPYPATGQVSYAYTYDASGRLIGDVGTWSDGVEFWTETVSYDDVALRRDRAVTVDDSAEIPEISGPGYNETHELLDAAGRLLEVNHTRAGDDAPSLTDYRYDEQARLLTTIETTPAGDTATVDYIYSCP